MSELVLVEIADGVATITLNRPEAMNALSIALRRALHDAVRRVDDDEAVRAVVLTGAGERAFVGGADIDEMAALDGPDAARAFILRVHRCCDAVRALPVPVIARIQGYCFGAGLELAASCDLRVAAEGAQLGMLEVRLGIPSVVEAALLPGLVGWGRAREILLLGESFPAAKALAWGLVEAVVPAAGLDAAVEAWLDQLLACAPGAVRRPTVRWSGSRSSGSTAPRAMASSCATTSPATSSCTSRPCAAAGLRICSPARTS